jgi:transposase
VHSWTKRRLRDLPWGIWQVWLVVDVHRVRCRRCGVRTERLPFDMWEPCAQGLRAHLPQARIVSDKFHVLRHGNHAVDETRRAECFRKGGQARGLHRSLDGLLASCHETVPFGKIEAINGYIRTVLRRGRGYRDHEYLLLQVQQATAERHQSLRAA